MTGTLPLRRHAVLTSPSLVRYAYVSDVMLIEMEGNTCQKIFRMSVLVTRAVKKNHIFLSSVEVKINCVQFTKKYYWIMVKEKEFVDRKTQKEKYLVKIYMSSFIVIVTVHSCAL